MRMRMCMRMHVWKRTRTHARALFRSRAQICELLRGVPSRVVVESELKLAAGLPAREKGHRLWRK